MSLGTVDEPTTHKHMLREVGGWVGGIEASLIDAYMMLVVFTLPVPIIFHNFYSFECSCNQVLDY